MDTTKHLNTSSMLVNMNSCGLSVGPSNRSNSVSSLDLEVESVSEGGPGPSGSNGAEALQLLEHEQGEFVFYSISPQKISSNKLNSIHKSFLVKVAKLDYYSGL